MDQFTRNVGKFVANNLNGGLDAGTKKIVEHVQEMLEEIEKKNKISLKKYKEKSNFETYSEILNESLSSFKISTSAKGKKSKSTTAYNVFGTENKEQIEEECLKTLKTQKKKGEKLEVNKDGKIKIPISLRSKTQGQMWKALSEKEKKKYTEKAKNTNEKGKDDKTLEDCNLTELKEKCKESGLTGYSKLNKEDLINLLNSEQEPSKKIKKKKSKEEVTDKESEDDKSEKETEDDKEDKSDKEEDDFKESEKESEEEDAKKSKKKK